MPHDPARVAETKAWLNRAESDLRTADYEFGATPPLLADIVFHCQQAAEKSLRAFLTWHDVAFRRTHSLEEMGEQCLQVDRTLKPLIDRAVPLTAYAWKFRYPGEPDEPSTAEAQEALATARDVYEAVLNRLPDETRP